MSHLATKLAPLYDLLQKESKWHWGTIQEQAFQDAMNALWNDTLLVHYDSSKQLVLACDASPMVLEQYYPQDGEERPVACGSWTLTAAEKDYSTIQEQAFQDAMNALWNDTLLVHYDSSKQLVLACDASPMVLEQYYPQDGEERPVACGSWTLTAAEKDYSQLEKETLAVVYGYMQWGQFHYNWYSRHFIIQSDHQPLSFLFSNSKAISQTASSRIKQWSLTLSTYSYSITHKPVKNLGNVDAISRLPQPVTTESDCLPGDLVHLVNHLSATTITAAHIWQWTDKDPVLSKVRHYLQQGWPSSKLEEFKPLKSKKNELSIMNGCILWGVWVVVPPPGCKGC